MSCHFDVYGYRFQVQADSPRALDGLAQDFAFFESKPHEGEVRIELYRRPPNYDQLPDLTASVYTPRNVTYCQGGVRYIDYHGRGVAVWDQARRRFTVTSESEDLLYEAAYLFLLAQIGEYADRVGLHRLHALAVSLNGKAILALLPMGGGKSTLGGALLRYPEVRLLSDDSPLIDRQGTVHAFPLHLGLLELPGEDVPSEHIRTIERMEFGRKVLVNYRYFAHRVCPSAEPGLVLLGRRRSGLGCRLEPAGRLEALRAIFINGVVGMGLFQGMEFLLGSSWLELAGKIRVAVSRLRNFRQLLRRSKTFRVDLGRDPVENARTILEFAAEHLGHHA